MAKGDGLGCMADDMASILVTRDQFNVTPQGVTHKPTDASFVPHCGDPCSGSMRLGRLECEVATGDYYDREVVESMMRQLWAEYLTTNSDLFFKRASESDCYAKNRLSDDRHSTSDG